MSDRDAILFRPDVVEYGLDLLSGQFANSSNLRDLMEIFLEEVQLIEDTMFDLFVERTLRTAEGAQLDQLGDIVGEPRGSLNDSEYRRFIRIRVDSAICEGSVPEITSIIGEMAGAIRTEYRYVGTGSYDLYCETTQPLPSPIKDRISERVLKVTSAGFGPSVFEVVEDETARFDADLDEPGFDTGRFAYDIRVQ